MSQEMADGTELGQRVFRFRVDQSWNMVGLSRIPEFVADSRALSLAVLQDHVRRNLTRNVSFSLVFEEGQQREVGAVDVPLVCPQLWQLVQPRLSGTAGPHTLRVLCLRSEPGAHRGLTSFRQALSLFSVVSPLPGLVPSLHLSQLQALCAAILERRTVLPLKLRAQLWKNILGVFPPSKRTRGERAQYFQELCSASREMKRAWLSRYTEGRPETLVLFNSIKRDARRTDPSEPFFAPHAGAVSPHGTDSVSLLCNVVMTFVEEHKALSYTQGMTDLAAPLLYVVGRAKGLAGQQLTAEVESHVYVMYCAMMSGIAENFTPNCRGALERVECLRHLCQALDPALHGKLASLEDDAFSLCFGSVLIDCKRDFPFQQSLDVMEVIWASRFGSRPQEAGLVEWAGFLTSESKSLLHHAIGGEVPLSTGHSTASSSGDHVVEERCYDEEPGVGYRVQPLPPNSEGVTQSLVESGRVSPFRPFDPQPSLSTVQVDTEGMESSMASNHSLLRQPLDLSAGVRVRVQTSFSLFVSLAILVTLRRQLMEPQVDFVGVSQALARARGREGLDSERVLTLACSLHKQYRQYQNMLCLTPQQWINEAGPTLDSNTNG